MGTLHTCAILNQLFEASVLNDSFSAPERQCPICTSSRLVPDFRLKTHEDLVLSWARCAFCGFTFMNPKLALEKMRTIYRSSGYWNEMSYGVYLADEHIRLKNALRNWRFSSRFLPQSGRLLDIGCATGFFGAVATKHGYDVVGIDPAEELVDFGRRMHGLDLRTTTIEEAFFDPASFDVVSLWGTDSHFYDVRAGFTKIVDWLRPGGHFLFSYQDYGHWIRFLFPQIKQAANVYYNFTKTSCHLLMEQLGLDILAERTAIQTTQLHRLARTLCVAKTPWPRLESLKITLPTISYKIVVARKR